MASLKPKYIVNHVPEEEDKKKSRRTFADSNTFFFSADFKAWCSGKSEAAKKAKARF